MSKLRDDLLSSSSDRYPWSRIWTTAYQLKLPLILIPNPNPYLSLAYPDLPLFRVAVAVALLPGRAEQVVRFQQDHGGRGQAEAAVGAWLHGHQKPRELVLHEQLPAGIVRVYLLFILLHTWDHLFVVVVVCTPVFLTSRPRRCGRCGRPHLWSPDRNLM